MPVTIPSPVKRWPGEIVIGSPLTMPQYMAWVKASSEAENDPVKANRSGLYLPGVLACVEKWSLGGGFPSPVTAENFPGTPAKAQISLIFAAVDAIWTIVNEEDTPPNA